MFNSFKATIRKWAGLPIEDVTNLLKWSNGKSDVDFGNRNLLVASAAKDGQPVAYFVAEPTLIISNHAFDPLTTPSDTLQIGNSIDAALETEARKIGADRFLIVLPPGAPCEPDEVHLRVIYRQVVHKATTFTSCEKQLSNTPHTHTAKWFN